MGQLRFNTACLNHSKSGIERIGSNPSVDMGGSVNGLAHNRIRPRRRASKKASWVISCVSEFSTCKMN